MMSKLRTTILALLLLFGGLALAPQLAWAQAKAAAPTVSEHRDLCIKEMAKDAEIRVACMSTYSDEYHAQDSRQATKNNKHVVMAYAAIWGIVALFLVGMWLRQRKLTEQIAQLEAELKKAAAE